MQNKSIQVKGLQKSYKQLHVLKGVDFEVEEGQYFRPARLQRRGQDNDCQNPHHAAQTGQRNRHRQRIRCCVKARQCAAVDQSDRAICRRGRDFDRAGKSDHDCQAAAPQKSASGCGRFA